MNKNILILINIYLISTVILAYAAKPVEQIVFYKKGRNVTAKYIIRNDSLIEYSNAGNKLNYNFNSKELTDNEMVYKKKIKSIKTKEHIIKFKNNLFKIGSFSIIFNDSSNQNVTVISCDSVEVKCINYNENNIKTEKEKEFKTILDNYTTIFQDIINNKAP